MSAAILVLRPRPGADETAARARALGLAPAVAPLFTTRPLAWRAPDLVAFDAILLTSANAARLGGDAMTSLSALPCYAVGERTAEAARRAGFAEVRSGPADGAAVIETMAAQGVTSALHPCGRDHIALAHPAVAIVRVPVYAADAVDRLPAEAEQALRGGALALLHSPRAAALFARLVGGRRAGTAVAAISAAAAEAAGAGWRAVAVAGQPRDEALLELAAKLCQTKDGETRRRSE